MPGRQHNSMIGEEIAGVRREIGQARELALDAVGKLSAGFAGVNRAIAEAKPARAVAAKLGREISAIVTAMQFQDLLDQVLGQALRRLEAIEAEVGVEPEKGAGTGAAAQRGKAVAQRRVDPGDVELF